MTILCAVRVFSQTPVKIGDRTSVTTADNTHYAGELYGGGVVFYVDNTKHHGLICSMIDIGTSQAWSDVTEYHSASPRSIERLGRTDEYNSNSGTKRNNQRCRFVRYLHKF